MEKINADTQRHIDTVRRLIDVFIIELLKRAEEHDASKHSDLEASTFEEYSPKLSGCTYGSDEYREYLAAMRPTLEHHYQNNRHHPEHYSDGIGGMSLIDIVEMFLDWLAATQRHADGDIYKSIVLNTSRFGMSKQLAAILVNTVVYLEEIGACCVTPRVTE